jgi:hypothetical protein
MKHAIQASRSSSSDTLIYVKFGATFSLSCNSHGMCAGLYKDELIEPNFV